MNNRFSFACKSVSLTLCVSLIGGSGGMKVTSWPSSLTEHWISESRPANHGILFRLDGTGTLEGNDSKAAGPPINWYVQSEKLFIRLYGEEGKSGGWEFEEYSYTITGAKLTIDPPIHLESHYVLKK